MKSTTLRILFTVAILVGLAAAPDAQTFTWQAGRSYDTAQRAERVAETARRNAERSMRNAERIMEQQLRNADRIADQARRNAERIEVQTRARIDAQVRNQVRIASARNSYYSYGYPYTYRSSSSFSRNADNAGAQVGSDADPCRDNNNGDRDYERSCEVRESTMAAGPLNVDAGQNGGISIEGWDRNEIRVRAVVQASAETASQAKALASQVQVQAGGGRVYATGPENLRREWWSVSYRINVPRKNDLDLRANNGGITIAGVSGNMRFDTTNGGVKLQDIGGRVNGATRNGGLNVTLSGSRWDGEGLDVETSNGGVTVSIPEGYNAEFETRTVNGGLRIDFPMTVQGELTGRRGLSTTLGAGGPLIRARTTNGGVTIRRAEGR
jgi:TolA-binding protein